MTHTVEDWFDLYGYANRYYSILVGGGMKVKFPYWRRMDEDIRGKRCILTYSFDEDNVLSIHASRGELEKELTGYTRKWTIHNILKIKTRSAKI